ncbi:hypothetical protein MNBD_GAMMA16-1783 [hydrothermal vent metagenome]|uniref:Uncharacterized protein n=1 Tax=hydrothermal vent metagenome TaxID=652676 RepID=A0A3B0ZRB5_9ZZZZ
MWIEKLAGQYYIDIAPIFFTALQSKPVLDCYYSSAPTIVGEESTIQQGKMMKRSITTVGLGVILAALIISTPLLAANDPSIKGSLRENIQQSMTHFIDQQTIDQHLYVYDAVKGKLLQLTLEKLHSGIVKKGDFYVSCADFVDQNGNKIDIDFMVRKGKNRLITTQALVHSINGKKRQYHLEML